MNLPQQLLKRETIDPKLAVGSSLPNPKGLLAIVLALYLVTDEKDSLNYSDKSGNAIILKPSLITLLKTFFNGITGYSDTEIDSLASANPLVEMQIEPLQVPLQLFWKIAKINILGTDSSTGERTGGVRFPKELHFTTNMDILKSVISDENEDITNIGKELIYNWLTKKATTLRSIKIEQKLVRTLLILSEETLFKTWNNTTEIIFQQEGIYNALNIANPKVDLKGSKEIKGTLRNLKSSIEKDLHPYLNIKNSEVELKDWSAFIQFENYRNRVSNYLDLNPKSLEVKTLEIPEEGKSISQNQVIISNKKLKSIIFESFIYVKNKTDEDFLLMGNELKESKIESRKYNGVMLPKYFNSEVLIGIFPNKQTNKNLKSGGNSRFIESKITILGYENAYFTSQWNESNEKGLSLVNFNSFLKDISNDTLEIIKTEDIFQLMEKRTSFRKGQNKIFYGAPGTGKSHKVKEIVKGKDERTERVTFHPEYDYSSFVGGYKPTMDGDNIRYEFVPQAFTNIYIKAWNDLENDYYLIIEEINRGNCSEIFGDIFQLLDRTNDYKITPSKELKEYLEVHLTDKVNAVKLLLPPNLNILATMNTSDQSLFPMDSAFKRRWDWEYIPINYSRIEEENSSAKFIVKISEDESFKWLDFIKKINEKISRNDNLGMDKCLGNYFIKPENDKIDIDTFINKAIFYLWNDVFKDEREEESIFKDKTTYEKFFPIDVDNGIQRVRDILDDLDIDYKSSN